MTLLPRHLQDLLPSSDSSCPAEPLADGRWVVAGTYALILLGEGGVEDSGMWYEVQTVRWETSAQLLTVNWVDPQRSPWTLSVSSGDPARWMRAVTERVERTQVMARSLRDEVTGSSITVQIRRREDGVLFSVVTASGVLSDEGERAAAACERALREDVGLE